MQSNHSPYFTITMDTSTSCNLQDQNMVYPHFQIKPKGTKLLAAVCWSHLLPYEST